VDEQRIVDDILGSSHYKVDMKKAEALRAASEKKPLDHETVEQILAGTKKAKPSRPAAFKLKPKLISKYFTPEQKPAEIEATIIAALDFYYANKNQERGLTRDGDDNNENISATDLAGTALVPEGALG
jgi:ParB family chromosome partitioning protein